MRYLHILGNAAAERTETVQKSGFFVLATELLTTEGVD